MSTEKLSGVSAREIPTCAITGHVSGHPDACGDCDPCSASYCVPPSVKRLIAEINEWRGKYEDVAVQNDSLLAENERLREALKPFAAIPPVVYSELDGDPLYAAHYWAVVGHPGKSHFTREDLAKARSSLSLGRGEGDLVQPRSVAGSTPCDHLIAENEKLKGALRSILFEDSDKPEQRRIHDRLKAMMLIEPLHPVDGGDA